MELIREQYGLVALRIGYSQGSRSEGERRDVTCSLRSPDVGDDDWRVPADGIPLLATTTQTRSDAGVEAGLVESCHRLEVSPAVGRLRENHEPLWLAVTAEHPLLAGVAWELGLDAVGLPVLRLPGQLNTAPTTSPPRPRVAVCVSMPTAKEDFPVVDLVGQVLDAVNLVSVAAEVHVFADAEWALVLVERFGGRAQVHHPGFEGPHDVARRSVRPGGDRFVDHQPWLAWIEDQMEGRVDVLHLIGHGYLATGQGAFAVAEAPDKNYDTRTARFVWPQQIAAFMTSTGAWGLVATAAKQNYSVPGLRLLTSQVAALRAAATAFLDISELADPALVGSVYRLLLDYPAPAPSATRGLTLIMDPGRFGLGRRRGTTTYQPARTELASQVDSGEDLPAWMIGAQHQVRQWETELSFESDAGQVESTRTALEVAKARLDEVMRATWQSGGEA
jgi:hypothetical protein